MTAAKRSYVCDECRIYSPGWHYDQDGNASPCPAKLAAKAAGEMQDTLARLTSEQREQAKEAARRIVADAAHTRAFFSANQIRAELDAAQIPGSLVGGAFTWARDQGLIVKTVERVQSDEDTTRHEIPIWRSLVYGNRRTA